jgi:hypothetical protein
MTLPPVDEIEALLEKATPGPWRWEVSLHAKSAQICGGVKYDLTVMDFVRWGMSHAAPRFWTWRKRPSSTAVNGRWFWVADDPQRVDAVAVPVPGREHHGDWFRDIDHPDAALIALAPALACAYVEQAARLAAAEKLAEAVAKTHDHCDDPWIGDVLAAALAEYRATKGDAQ